MVLVNLSVFLLVVFVLFCWCLCFWLSFIIPFFSLVFFVLPVIFLPFWSYNSSCSCSVSFHPPVLPSLVSFLFITYVVLIYFSFISCFLACISVWLFLLWKLLSLFLLFLILCVFFSPGLCAQLKRNTMKKNTYFVLLAFGDLCEKILSQNDCFLFLWWISFIHQKMSLLDVLGIPMFEGVRERLLNLMLFLFGTEFSFGQVVSCACIGFVVFFVRVLLLFGVSACRVILWVLFFVLVASAWKTLFPPP